MTTILTLVNAHALAHVSRPLEVAKVLKARGVNTVFGGHGKYLEVAANNGFATVEVPYIPVEQVVDAVRAQHLDRLYKREQITGYVEAELDAYRRVRPDAVLVDNRPTAMISAESAGIKTVSILNVHMSQFKEIPFHSIRNVTALGAVTPFKYLDRVENLIEGFFIDKLVMKDLGLLRKAMGLKAKFGFSHEQGDLNLFPDLPEFNPATPLPGNTKYIGPLTWHNDLPAPECFRHIEQSKKCIYFTVGSEGLEELIRNAETYFGKERPIIMAMGEIEPAGAQSMPPNVYREKFVNADRVLPRCELVVCHGGNGTIYQALSYGVPIVGVAMHEEQHYGLKRVNELELGVGFHVKRLRKEGPRLLINAIAEVLRNEKFRRNAQKFRDLIAANGSSAEKAADYILAFIGRGGQ